MTHPTNTLSHIQCPIATPQAPYDPYLPPMTIPCDFQVQQALSGHSSPGGSGGGTTGFDGESGNVGGGNSNSGHQLVLPQDLKGLQFIFDWGYPKVIIPFPTLPAIITLTLSLTPSQLRP